MKTKIFIDSDVMYRFGLSLLDMAILSYINSFQINDRRCYTSIRKLSEQFNVTTRTVDNAIKRLKEKKLLYCENNIKYIPPGKSELLFNEDKESHRYFIKNRPKSDLVKLFNSVYGRITEKGGK